MGYGFEIKPLNSCIQRETKKKACDCQFLLLFFLVGRVSLEVKKKTNVYPLDNKHSLCMVLATIFAKNVFLQYANSFND